MNNILPFEILKKIFQNLIIKGQSKKDVKICSSVCKSWKVAAQEAFGKISIVVYEDSLEKLSRDIVHFVQRVKSITLNGRTTDIDRTVTCLVWFDIILACPNLVSIEIKAINDSTYVQCLMDTATERLDHIQTFNTATPKLNLELNLKYCKSITSLSITSLETFSENCRDDRLINFISLFPNLISFSSNGIYIDDVDIIQFLAVAPQLQELSASVFYEVKSSPKIIPENSHLTVLHLKVQRIDINSLIFITTRLKNLNQLMLKIDDLINIVPQEIFGMRNEYSPEELLDDLKDYTSRLSEFFIKYNYEDTTYILESGEEPEIFPFEGNFDSNDDEENEYDEDGYVYYNYSDDEDGSVYYNYSDDDYNSNASYDDNSIFYYNYKDYYDD